MGRSVGSFVSVLVVLLVGAGAWWYLGRPRVFEVGFAELPILMEDDAGSITPLAAEGWPTCSPDLVDVRPEPGRDRVSFTVRPLEDTQCALPWSPVAWWTTGSGERIEAPIRNESKPPILLMGAAGASASGTLRRQCPIHEPLTLHLELDGREEEIGALTDPDCGAKATRAGRLWFQYRQDGLVTPAGWLDAVIDAPRPVSGDTLRFVLEMTNDTDEEIPIGRCPFYEAAFVTESERVEARSYLNCPAAPDRVRPGDVIRFEIDLPLDGVTGTGRLELELRDENRTLHRITSDEVEVAA